MRIGIALLTILTLCPLARAGNPPSLLYAPAGADDPELRSEIAAELGGGTVDYFDARFGTPSSSLLASYDAVCTWTPLAYDDPELFGDRLADYHDAGGRVILALHSIRDEGIQGRLRTEGRIPVVLDSDTLGNNGVWDGDHYSFVWDHVDAISSATYDRINQIAGNAGHGSYTSGYPLVVLSTSRRVAYLNGRPLPTSFGQGQWARFIANCARSGRVVRMLIHAPSVVDTVLPDQAWTRGYVATFTLTYGQFQAELQSGEYDVAVLSEQNAIIPLEAAEALQDFVEGGGSALMNYFDLDGSALWASAAILRETFGVASVTSLTTAQTIYSWVDNDLAFSGDYIDPEPSSYFDNGDRMEPVPGAMALAGFTSTPMPGEAAVVLANEGRTMVNGFLIDDYDSVWAMIMIGSQLRYLSHRSNVLVLSGGGSERQYLRRATDLMGLDPVATAAVAPFLRELTLRHYDLLIIDQQNGDFTGPEALFLAQFVAEGGRIVASNRLLTESIGVGELFGVLDTDELDQPTEWTPTVPEHAMFQAPHPIGPVEIEPTSFFYHGLALRPSPSGTTVAEFDSLAAPTNSAIVLANGGKTVLSGFFFDDLNHHQALDLAENQIAFVLGQSGDGAVEFIRGDCNRDGSLGLPDAISSLNVLFAGAETPECPAACDTNGDGFYNLADAIGLLNHLFVAGSPDPAAPFPECGSAPTPLPCAENPVCP